MKATMTIIGKSCLIWHRWALVKDTGHTKYLQCKDCRARRAQQPDVAGYQPINMDWLAGKTDAV